MFNPSKLKNIFKSKNDLDNSYGVKINTRVLSISDSAYLCSTAAKTCYNLKASKLYNENLNHIKRIIGYGHDSIIGHSNVIFLLEIKTDSKSPADDFIYSILPSLKFMNISLLPYKIKFNNDGSVDSNRTIRYLISGSARAFRYFVMEYENNSTRFYDNTLFDKVINIIYSSFEKELFADFIKNGVLEEKNFKYVAPMLIDTSIDEDTVDTKDMQVIHQPLISLNHVAILYRDDIYKLYEELSDIDEVEDKDELLNCVLNCSIVSLELRNYSRAISQQINRHLSAISQESQRYVDYTNSSFINPLVFDKEYYTDINKKYHVKVADSELDLTSQELGELIISIYPQLIEQGMKKQDARSFLPMNSETKTVHTFTWRNLIHFIKLRSSNAAQPEVRCISDEIKSLILKKIDKDDEDFGYNIITNKINDLMSSK